MGIQENFVAYFPQHWQSNDSRWLLRKTLPHAFHDTDDPMTIYSCVGQDLVRFGVKSEYITISTILQLSSFFRTIMTPVIMSDDVRIHF